MADTTAPIAPDIVTDDSTTAAGEPQAGRTTGTGPPAPRSSRIGRVHAGLVVAAAVLVLLLVFILENAHSVSVGFFGAHLRVPLAVALLLSGVGGALLVGAIGAARIAQLRRAVHREVDRVDQLR